ncbi:hypothetical protein [Massilia oculi]|uniref:hypothetical protein n=1 Tax=Massilia oculi TaxID=945844 RepID=UPI0028A8A697|nr:hypothetical protein [Massilia oculi]
MSTMTKEMDTQAESLGASITEDLLKQARARRLAALKAAEGLWKDRLDIPKDGVKTQDLLRSEWK